MRERSQSPISREEVRYPRGTELECDVDGELILNNVGKQLWPWELDGAQVVYREGQKVKARVDRPGRDEWIQVGTKGGKLIGVWAAHAPDLAIGLEQLQENFNRNMTSWRQSPCKVALLDWLRRTQPDDGWRIQKTVCLGTGSFSTSRYSFNEKTMQQLAFAMDMTAELNAMDTTDQHSSEKGAEIVAQDPSYRQVDKDFLASIGVNVLESKFIDVRDGEVGVGNAKQHLGDDTFVLEFHMARTRQVFKDLYQSNCKIVVGRNDDWLSIENQYLAGARRLSEFEECPWPVDLLTIHVNAASHPHMERGADLEDQGDTVAAGSAVRLIDDVQSASDAEGELILNQLGKQVRPWCFEAALILNQKGSETIDIRGDLSTWTEVGSKGGKPVGILTMDVPDSSISTDSLRKEFAIRTSIWEESSCRKNLLDGLRRLQPDDGWQIEKVVVLALGSLTTASPAVNRRRMQHLAFARDMALELVNADVLGVAKIFARDPAFTQTDKRFLNGLRIKVLECAHPDDADTVGLGEAKYHLGPRTLVLELILPAIRQSFEDLYQSDSSILIGHTEHHRNGSALLDFPLSSLLSSFEQQYQEESFPFFEEDPVTFSALRVHCNAVSNLTSDSEANTESDSEAVKDGEEDELILNKTGKEVKPWYLRQALTLRREEVLHGGDHDCIQIGSKNGKTVGMMRRFVPDKAITLASLHQYFDRKIAIWRQSACRKDLFLMLDRMRPDEGWDIRKTVYITNGSLATADHDHNSPAMQRLAMILDMAQELNDPGEMGLQVYIQNADLFQIDRDFLRAKDVTVLEVGSPGDQLQVRLGEAKQHLGPHTLVFEHFTRPKSDQVMEGLLPSNSRLYFMSPPERLSNKDYQSTDSEATKFLQKYWCRKFPSFMEYNGALELNTAIYSKDPCDMDADTDWEADIRDEAEAAMNSKGDELILNALGKQMRNLEIKYLLDDRRQKDQRNSVMVGYHKGKPVRALKVAVPDSSMTLERLQTSFDTTMEAWLQTYTRKALLARLEEVRPKQCWHLNKAVCVATGDFSMLDSDCNNTHMQQFVCFMDLVATLEEKRSDAGEASIKTFVQDPAFRDIDKDFLRSKGVTVLETEFSAPAAKLSALGEARQHLGPDSLLFEAPFFARDLPTAVDLWVMNSRLYNISNYAGSMSNEEREIDGVEDLNIPMLYEYGLGLRMHHKWSNALPAAIYWHAEPDPDGDGPDADEYSEGCVVE